MEKYNTTDLEQLTIRQVTDLVIALREEIKSLITEQDKIKAMDVGIYTSPNVNPIQALLFIEEIILSRLTPEKLVTAKALKELGFKIFDATNID